MTTTKTSEFLRSGKTLQNLYQRYDIQYFVNDELGIVVFNYRPLSPKSSQIVRECRGLILELDTWNVVCKPIEAFFEPTESGYKSVHDKFDWSSARAMNKIDGALVCLYFYKGEWRCSTRFSTDGSSAVKSPNQSGRQVTWRQLVEETLEKNGTNWHEYTSKLNPEISYVFELVTPDNRVVVLYAASHLYLVAAIDTKNLKEIDILTLGFHGEIAPYKKVNSLTDVYALIEKEPDAYKNEGYVVVDSNFNRLKIRNPKYAEAMRVYSIDDELSALRELRMLDVSGFTIITDGPEEPPMTVPPTGTPPPSTGGTGGTIAETGRVTVGQDLMGFATSYSGLSVAPTSLRNVLNRVLYLAKFISDAYENAVSENIEINKSLHYHIWPQAFEGLKNGQSVSDVLDSSSDHELMAALRRYETQAGRNTTEE
jgi:hypothetical protein